ncbi:MAG: single-stranded-DNA-specific exonuclease RecJ [Deltaproteobacteria bacterium]|nr:single-stranded-DNA-specific exonuclease RecJ [Deltaproteobacteria bacterium]
MAGRVERRWTLRAPDAEAVREIRAATGLSPTAASILVNRGIVAPADAGAFLSGTLRDLSEPHAMKGLAEGSARLFEAGRRREPVLIYADYDADGAGLHAVLFLTLREIFPDLPVRVHQNHRTRDGYGIKDVHLEEAAREGVRVVVTVDCGISDVGPVSRAAARGIDVIVTDHHLPGDELPPAFAVIDPRRKDCPHPDKDLAGVGVAFLLACGVRRAARDADPAGNGPLPNMRQCLDLVALGTVADMVPLRGDNRIFVRAGLEEMRARPRPGIRALMAVAGCSGETVSETDLAFRLGPRLNAASRVGDPGRSFEILVTDDDSIAAPIAAELHRDNARRQAEEERILREAERLLSAAPPGPGYGAIVLSDPAWHPGVLGIVASRLADRFHRPTVLLREEEGEAKGSCRSVEEFPLIDALAELAPILSRYGGHRQAAGVAMPLANLPAFREGLAGIARRYAEGRDVSPRIFVDAEVGLRDVSTAFLAELERLRPFGMGNEEPVLLVRNVRVGRVVPMGADGRHTRFEVADRDRRFEVVAFHRNGLPVGPGEPLDLLFTPQRNHYRGTGSVRLMHRDARPHVP